MSCGCSSPAVIPVAATAIHSDSGRRRRPLSRLVAVFLVLAPLTAAADPPRAPGVNAEDGRQVMDITRPPWNSVARVQTNIGGKCTGTVIGPRLVLTAAHCLYNHRTRALLAAGSLHVLLGYERGDYKLHLTVERLHVPPGYDGSRPGESLTADWALLRLSGDAQVPALPLSSRPARPTDKVAVAGFSQDRVHLLMADRDCAVLTTSTGPLLVHDCSASRGTSGGPLLIQDGAIWRVGGVNVGISGRAGNIAIWPQDLNAAISALSAP